MRSVLRVLAPVLLLAGSSPAWSSPGFPSPAPPSVTPMVATTMTPAESLWYARLLAGMQGSSLLIENTMLSGDSYSIGRDGGNYVEALLMAYRATGDIGLLDRVYDLTQLARSRLVDAWLDGTTDGYTDWLWLADPNNTTFYGKDTNWLDESIASGNVALWMRALHQNRYLDPRFAEAADFWRGWLESQFLAKWYRRAGGDSLGAWNTPYLAFYKPDTEPRSANWRLAYYLWAVGGNPFYLARANEIRNQLLAAQVVNPAHPTAYRWAKELDPATQNWQLVNYANYYVRVIIEMNLEGQAGFSSAAQMKPFASTFRDVVYANSLPGLTGMTNDVSGGGSTTYALYAFNGLSPWDSTGFLMNLANKSIVGAGNYAPGGLSKAARNDTFISGYALMALGLAPTTTDVTVTAFRALPEGDGAVRIEWELSAEAADIGAVVYRVSRDGADRVRLNDTPIAGPGTHVLIDTPPSGTDVLDYELAQVTADGEQTLARIQVRRARVDSGALALGQSWPNPFATSTQISFELARAGRVRLAIYDARGSQVRLLEDRDLAPGPHDAQWDGRDARGSAVPSGLYFVVAESGRERIVRKAVRLK